MSKIFSYDPAELKRSLIEFYQSKPEFADFNYDGSAINTIIDNLVRNTHYIAYMANMVGTESFLDSAQLRANIVSHAQKLSYVPRSRTATTVVVDLVVTPSSPPAPGTISIEAPKGTVVFINTIGNTRYTFTNPESFTLSRTSDGTFTAQDIVLKQGQVMTHKFLFSGKPLEIPNKNIDSSTIKVFVKENVALDRLEYQKVENIVDVGQDSNVFYLSENHNGRYTIDFGKDVLGRQPVNNAEIEVEYVSVSAEHANGIKTLHAVTPIGGYSNIQVTVTTEGYGGSERASNEFVKFIAPKLYQAQNRAVRIQDYKAIMLREFPFIVTANAWGGEDNVPPYYGRVFVCAVPEQGFVIANTVKSMIEKRMKEFSMMTVEVVDPEYLMVVLSIKADYRSEETTDTFTQIATKIQSIVDAYNEEILEFGRRFDNSLLTSRIRENIPTISSVEISSKVVIKKDSIPNKNSAYELQFLNSILPGSFRIDNVVMDERGTEQYIKDNGNGVINKHVVINNVENIEEIGQIDYETGHVKFTTMILNEVEMRANATPSTLNIYTERNTIVRIESSDIQRLVVRG